MNMKNKTIGMVGGAIFLLLIIVYNFSSLKNTTDMESQQAVDIKIQEHEKIIAYVRAEQKKATEGKDIVLAEEIVRDPNGRALFIAQYPEFSNAKMKKTIDDFLTHNKQEFDEIIKEQEATFEEYKNEKRDFPASLVIQRILTFELPNFSETLKAIRFIVWESSGGTGSEDTVLFTFGEQGDVISSKDFFVDFDTALKTLSEMVQEDLLVRFGEEGVFLEGAEPSPDNYKNITFDDTGNLVVYFDKYQVTSGANGSVAVTLKKDEIKTLLHPEFITLFNP